MLFIGFRLKSSIRWVDSQNWISGRKCRDRKFRGKCLTKGTGNENLGRAIDEYREKFERKARVKK